MKKLTKKLNIFFLSIISCPTGCSTPLPPFDADYCDPDTTNAQIPVIYLMALDGAAFSDITDPVEWAARLDQTDVADPDKVRTLHVIGSKPVPDSTDVDLGNDKTITINKTHTLELTVRETGDNNYDFLRTTECAGNYKIAYVIGKYLFVNSDTTGNVDNDFIECSIKMSDTATENFSDPYEFKMTVMWKRKFSPGRITNPIA